MRYITLIACVLFLIPTAQAQQRTTVPVICGPYQQAVELLSQKYNEAPIGRGIADGLLLEVWLSSIGTFTFVMVSPNGTACFLGSGEGWEPVATGTKS